MQGLVEEHYFKKLEKQGSPGSYLYAKEAAILAQSILKAKLEEFKSLDEVLNTIQLLHDTITPYKPTEFSIANVIRRITSIIREQAKSEGLYIAKEVEREKQENKFILRLSSLTSFHTIEGGETLSTTDVEKSVLRFKTKVLEEVDDIISEFDEITPQINQSAVKHINNNEIIIVFGNSYTVANLLIEAKKQKIFEVIVVENNLSKNGHEMAKKLTDAKIKTTLVPDTAVYAVMHRVHKAFISKFFYQVNP